MQTLEMLRSHFGNVEGVTFSEGQGGLPRVLLSHATGGTAEIYLLGATVTSWKQPKHGEVLFLSSKAQFLGGKAIRGGVPLIFPQFSGDGPLPAHGVARSRSWEICACTSDQQSGTTVVFRLQASAETRAIWDWDFELTFEVSLSERLAMTLQIKNTGTRPLTYQSALHTYFRVSDISETTSTGFAGLAYRDNVLGKMGIEDRNDIEITEETDRVYKNGPSHLQVIDSSGGRTIDIEKQNLSDAVLWNPWIEKAAKLSDLADDEFREFVCVEVGDILTPQTLQPGEIKRGGQVLSVESH